jgi:hypothetical protein
MIIGVLLFLLSILLIGSMTRHGGTRFSTLEVIAAFSFKVLMACLYGYLFLRYYGGDDTWALHNSSLAEFKLLTEQPGQFFWEFTPVSAWRNAQGHLWETIQRYLVDLEYCLTAKTLGLFNIISRGNYYANAVFFSFITFWGHYWLFNLLTGIFPQKRTLLLLLIFFFPPAVFWLSGIRADGLLLLFISLLLLHAYRLIQEGRKSSLAYVLLALTGLLIFRSVMVLLLLPALLSWYITTRYNRRPIAVFAMVYGLAIVLFFASPLLSATHHFPGLIVQRQQEFAALQGNTRFILDTLQPTVASFVQVFPQAVTNTFLRPYLWEAKGPLQIMAEIGRAHV